MYIVARTKSNRPSLMHRLDSSDPQLTTTECGINTFGWSRAYFTDPVKEILCKKCGEVSRKKGY